MTRSDSELCLLIARVDMNEVMVGANSTDAGVIVTFPLDGYEVTFDRCGTAAVRPDEPRAESE